MSFSRPSLLLGVVLAVAGSTAGCHTRYVTSSRVLGTSVSASVEHDAESRTLTTRVNAGQYPIERVQLIDARGRMRGPDAAVREGPEVVGGTRFGIGSGIGIGSGGFGSHRGDRDTRLHTGAGIGRTFGGRLVPGDYVARFLDPPIGAQPWTLRVVTGGEPSVVTDVLLAELKNREEVQSAAGAALLLELPDGETRQFAKSRTEEGEARYDAVEPADR